MNGLKQIWHRLGQCAAVQKARKSILLPLAALFAVTAVFHFHMRINFGDDIGYYRNALDHTSLFSFLRYRYLGWSSRTLIEAAIPYFDRLPHMIWRSMDLLMILLLVWSLWRLVGFRDKQAGAWLTAGLFLLYPLTYMFTAGWIATTITYLWTTALGLFSLTLFKRLDEGARIPWYQAAVYVAAALFAANQEQMTFILLLICLICMGALIVHKKRIAAAVAVLAAVVANLAYILSCPGNRLRSVVDMGYFIPNYGAYTLLDKLYMGLNSTFYVLMDQSDYLLFIFCGVLCFCVFLRTKNVWHRMVSCIPAVVTVLIALTPKILDVPYLLKYIEKNRELVDVSTASQYSSYITVALYIGLIGSTLLSLLVLYGVSFDLLLNAAVFGGGFATRIVMGFTPLFYASEGRTYILLYMSLIYCILYMVRTFEAEFTPSRRNTLGVATGIAALLTALQFRGT